MCSGFAETTGKPHTEPVGECGRSKQTKSSPSMSSQAPAMRRRTVVSSAMSYDLTTLSSEICKPPLNESSSGVRHHKIGVNTPDCSVYEVVVGPKVC